MTMQEVGDRGVRREPLVPVDHPLVAVAHGGRREQRRVGAGAGLGHREARAVLAVEQRLHPALLLLVGAADGDQLGVAGVGRVVAEDARAVHGLAEDLVHQAELDLAEPEPAHVRRQVGGPQALALDLLLQRVGDPPERLAALRRAPLLGAASRAGRSRRGRSPPSSPASPGSRGRSRSPMPCGRQYGRTAHRALTRAAVTWADHGPAPAATAASPQTATCFRHPDREAGRRCTRCGRPACSECLVQASVGSHCVECAQRRQARTSRRGPATGAPASRRSSPTR